MARRIVVWVPLALVIVALVAGCGTRARQSNQMAKLNAELDDVRLQGAKICAPREYAAAEAHLDFAKEEWSERDYIRAQDHLVFAQEGIDGARKWLTNCVEQVPPDKDGDGVMDNVDKCPDVPGLPEFDGCPDSDGDGIPDDLDKCPDVPGLPEFNGCPDTDGDGIADADDGCPEAFGLPENNGCPKLIEISGNQILLKQTVLFDTGRAVIKPDSFEMLNEIAAVLKASKTWKVQVEGHTDSTGNKAKNQTLSQERAGACRDYLINQGVAASQLTAIGYGPDHPIASNNTTVGRQQNRRTEFKIVSK